MHFGRLVYQYILSHLKFLYVLGFTLNHQKLLISFQYSSKFYTNIVHTYFCRKNISKPFLKEFPIELIAFGDDSK